MPNNDPASKNSGPSEEGRDAPLFEKFEIIEPLGSGGMGKVFKAKQIDLDKLVALKVLDSIKDNKAVIRFQNEAKAVSRLSHPNIAQVLDFGVTKSGEPYMSMELVDGMTLQRYITLEGKLNAETFLQIFIQVAGALAHAHQKGIVHRDIKPGNIMLDRDEHENFVVKVLDFGVAKLLTEEDEEGFDTDPGGIVGSPLYMSPEQASGKRITPHSDMYSLGCVMYQCLSGRPPFQAENAIDVLIKHRSEEPEDIRDELPDDPLSEDIALMVDRLLQKEPADRFATTDDITSVLKDMNEEFEEARRERMAALGIIVEDEDPATQSLTLFESLKESWKNKSVRIVVAALVFLSLIPTVWFFLPKQNTERTRDIFRKNESFTTMKTLDTFDIEVIRNELESNGTAFELESPSVNDKTLKIFEGHTTPEYIMLANSKVTDEGIKYLTAAKFIEQLSLVNTQVKTLKYLPQFKNVKSLDLANTKITDDSLKNLAKTNGLKILNLSETDITPAGLLNLATAPSLDHLTTNNCKNITIDDIKKLREEMPFCEFTSIPKNFYVEAIETKNSQNYPLATQQLKTCVKSIEKNFGKGSNRLILPLLNLCDVEKYSKNFAQAKKYLDRAEEIANECGCPNDQFIVRESRFFLSCDMDDDKVATKMMEQLIEIRNETKEHNSDPAISGYYHLLGDVYMRKGKFKEAAKKFKSSMEIRKQIPTTNKPDDENIELNNNYHFGEKGIETLAARMHYGTALIFAGEIKKGEEEINQAIKIFPAPTKSDHTTEAYILIDGYLMQGQMHMFHKQWDQARESNQAAMKLCERYPTLAQSKVATLRQQAEIERTDKKQ